MALDRPDSIQQSDAQVSVHNDSRSLGIDLRDVQSFQIDRQQNQGGADTSFNPMQGAQYDFGTSESLNQLYGVGANNNIAGRYVADRSEKDIAGRYVPDQSEHKTLVFRPDTDGGAEGQHEVVGKYVAQPDAEHKTLVYRPDTNENGGSDEHTHALVLAASGSNRSTSRATAGASDIFSKIDKDRNGMLSSQEWTSKFGSVAGTDKRASLNELKRSFGDNQQTGRIFKQANKNGDGSLTSKEWGDFFNQRESDADVDNALGRNELWNVPLATKEQVDAAMGKVQSNGNDQHLDEVRTALESIPKAFLKKFLADSRSSIKLTNETNGVGGSFSSSGEITVNVNNPALTTAIVASELAHFWDLGSRVPGSNFSSRPDLVAAYNKAVNQGRAPGDNSLTDPIEFMMPLGRLFANSGYRNDAYNVGLSPNIEIAFADALRRTS